MTLARWNNRMGNTLVAVVFIENVLMKSILRTFCPFFFDLEQLRKISNYCLILGFWKVTRPAPAPDRVTEHSARGVTSKPVKQ